MKRRKFLGTLGLAVAAWPIAVRAQQTTTPTIGFLAPGTSRDLAGRVQAFQRGLGEAGYVAGDNVAIEYRWAENDGRRLPALAADLVRRGAAVIVTTSGAASLVAKSATTTIPIVFYVGGDPIRLGLVTSLSRPDGNLTGVGNLSGEVGPKRLELLHELIPAAKSIAVLINPATTDTSHQVRDLHDAARNLNLELHVLEARTERDFDKAFMSLRQRQIRGLVVAGDLFFTSRSEQLAALALRHETPAVFQFREFAAAGGLLSYGGNFTDMYRQIGLYTGRILKGEKPAELPVQQATKAELIINLKTAKALGINVPLSLLGRADEVIE
jgi:putative ABC transport system substrate-binding protein